MATVAEHFAEQLSLAGVETVYGLPGGENVEILEAIRQRGIEFVLVKNESSACFMAATNARLTGKIGVALTTLGPGAANAYAGLAHAHLDRAPVLLITAATDPVDIGRHSHQVIDLQAIFQPVCKLTAELTAIKAVKTIRKALKLTKAGRPGPVHLSLHNRIALQDVEMQSTGIEASDDQQVEQHDVNDMHKLLADKRKPLIIVGLGLEPDRPYSLIQRLAESLKAPVIDTPKSKGALSADHPLFAGTIGLTRDDPVYELVADSDCIIAIGFDVVELVKPWDYEKPLIWIANWKNHDPLIACDSEYVGHIGDMLASIGEVSAQTADEWGYSRARHSAHQTPTANAKRILPQTFLSSLRDNTPDDIIMTTDVGSHKIFIALNWAARTPNRYFVSNGLSAMGFGLSSAIAAADITGRPTVCVTGDAGLAMVTGELGLLAEHKLPVLVMVMNDSALDLIRSAQMRKSRAVFGTEFVNPDYWHIAKAYGLAYRKVESRRDCDEAIRQGLSTGGAMLIDVMIDPIGYPTTVSGN